VRNVVPGYWQRPDETQPLHEGWLHSGADGSMMTDFGIVDRAKDIVIRGGRERPPIEVESVLFEHPVR
jgi:acyl-CoA synthetase (AMP-forming)/AMP-acid ligase II